MKITHIIKSLNDLAPPKLALGWDNVGLQIGNIDKDISSILLCLTVDSKVLAEAVNNKVDLIISHHPLIFKGLTKINSNKPVENIVMQLIKNDIALFVMHTNLDVVSPGVSTCLFEKVGGDLSTSKILSVTYQDKLYKLSCYVPEEDCEKVLSAMFEAGAGSIGDYDECSFSFKGTGTFRGGEGTNPHIGEQGKRENVSELKIETIVSECNIDKVKSAMIKNHPYEEVAYDVFELVQRGKKYGMGQYGKLKENIKLSDLIKKTDGILKGDKSDKTVKKLAVCGGSGSDLIEKAYKAGCDCFITGDIKYHDDVLAQEFGLSIIDMGHYHSELPVLGLIENYIQKIYDNNIKILIVE